MNRIKDSESNGFLCIDWDEHDPVLIFGGTSDAEYQRLEVILSPCSYIHDYISDNGDSVSPECIRDAAKQFEYVTSSLAMQVLHNSESLDSQKFGSDKIVKESLIKSIQFDPRSPSYVSVDL